MRPVCLLFCVALVTCQVNLASPRSRSGNPNIRVVGSTVGINPCGNGSDVEVRASRSPVAIFWHGGNATNISINFGNLNAFWSMSMVSYVNYTGPIDPNATIPLPPASAIVQLRPPERIGLTTNGSLNYLLRDYYWPLDAAAACRPGFYGCALRIVVTNPPSSNETYYTCSDIRVYSRSFDQRLIFTVKMNPGVVPPAPATMLNRIQTEYATKGLTDTNSAIEPSGASFTLRSDESFTFTLVISDTPGFNSDRVVATISADASTTLANTLGVATVTLGTPPDENPATDPGTTVAIVVIVLLLVLVIAGLLYVKVKKPATWKSWCDSLSNCCKPSKGTNI